MFRKLKPNLIESDSGFSVQLTESRKVIYREGGKAVTFPTQDSAGPILFEVLLGEYSDRWDPPSDTVKISDNDWTRIANNIREAYRSQGIRVEVHIVSPEVREAAKRRVSMWRKTKSNLIESDLGFSVEQVRFNKLVYREGDKKTTCTIELYGRGPVLGVVYLAEASDYWDPPFDTIKISEEEWKRIGDNIREAYLSQGSEVDIFLPPPEKRQLRPTLPPP
jgi:hypothetical protein